MAVPFRTRLVLILMRLTSGKPYHERTAVEVRDSVNRRAGKRKKHPTPVGSVRDLAIPAPDTSIHARFYTPVGAGPYPLLVFFHGGGWVICNLDTHDEICRMLCRNAQCAVLSVDYRLAPEHKFPAGLNDCLNATRWAVVHAGELGVDARRIAVAGDSAGGNLAAVTALRMRDEDTESLCGQLLIYPCADHYSGNHASMIRNGSGYGLTRDSMVWFWDHYLSSPEQGNHPDASPLRAGNHAGLAPAFVITAQFDPLCDEGEQYAERLKQAGNAVVSKRYAGAMHGFFSMAALLPQARIAIKDASEWLSNQFQLR